MTVKTSPDANGKILRDLEEDIVFGVFHPKERLTEEGLMARFGLKRHVVRNALSELDSIGLVVRVPNRGAYVRELTPEEVIEIYEVREILEVAAAMRTPLPAPKEVVDVMKKIQDQHNQIFRTRTFTKSGARSSANHQGYAGKESRRIGRNCS